MFGRVERAAVMYMFGCLFQGLPFFAMGAIPIDVLFVIMMAFIFYSFGFIYIMFLVHQNKCRPHIEECPPGKIVWHRFTKDGLYLPEFHDKMSFGCTKGVMYKHQSIIINKGDFPVRGINGNQGIIVYDLRCTNANLKHAAAWKKIFSKLGTRSGKDTYLLAEKNGKTISKQERKSSLEV